MSGATTTAQGDPVATQPSAVILLSTFNGEAFLKPLVRSLIDQDWPETRIIARDDGSSDGTLRELSHYKDGGFLDIVPGGVNLGAARSFMRLLEAAPQADVVLFADQDDVWYPDKVRRAIMGLRELPRERPALSCTGLDLVTSDFVPIGRSPVWPKAPSFENALVENIATGCTIALNRSAADLLRSRPLPAQAILHDWWAYLTVSAFGTVRYDPVPSLAYRMHGTNAVGLPRGPFTWFMEKVMRQVSGNTVKRIVDQAMAFEALFEDRLTPRQRTLIRRLARTRQFAGRLAFLAERDIHRQIWSDNLALKALVLMGRAR